MLSNLSRNAFWFFENGSNLYENHIRVSVRKSMLTVGMGLKLRYFPLSLSRPLAFQIVPISGVEHARSSY